VTRQRKTVLAVLAVIAVLFLVSASVYLISPG
jgi:hypothetical protein